MDNQRKATILALLSIGMWSTVATAFKLSLRHLDPFQLVVYASLFSVLVLVATVGLNRRLGDLWPAFHEQPRVFLLLGLLNPFGYYLILFHAYDLLPAQQAMSINYTWAITLGLMSIVFLKKAYGVRDGLGGLLGYLGVLIIATRGDLFSFDLDSPAGVILAFVTTLVWAVYWILNARMRVDPLLGLTLCFVCSLPFTLFACVLFSGLYPISMPGLLGAAYIGVVEMGVAFVFWLMAMRAASNVSRISNLIFLSPVLSLLLISSVLGEAIAPATLLGLCLVLAGTMVQQLWRKTDHRGIS